MAGRPTKYNQDILDQANNYLDTYLNKGEVVPTIAGLAVHLHISRETIYDWATHEDKEEFSDIVRELMAIQELNLANRSLIGDFNPTIAKLMLTKHNYSDKVETDITSGGKEIAHDWHIHPVTTKHGTEDSEA